MRQTPRVFLVCPAVQIAARLVNWPNTQQPPRMTALPMGDNRAAAELEAADGGEQMATHASAAVAAIGQCLIAEWHVTVQRREERLAEGQSSEGVADG